MVKRHIPLPHIRLGNNQECEAFERPSWVWLPHVVSSFCGKSSRAILLHQREILFGHYRQGYLRSYSYIRCQTALLDQSNFVITHVMECEYNDDFRSFLLFFAFRSGCVPLIAILSRGGYKRCIVRELVVKDILRGIKGVCGRTVNWVEVVLYVWYRRLDLGAQMSHTSQCDETSKGCTHSLSF